MKHIDNCTSPNKLQILYKVKMKSGNTTTLRCCVDNFGNTLGGGYYTRPKLLKHELQQLILSED